MKLITLKSTVLALIVASPMSVIASEQTDVHYASDNPVHAIAQVPITGVKLATGALAIPFLIVGEIGNVSEQVGDTLWQEANHQIPKPKSVADTINPSIRNDKFL